MRQPRHTAYQPALLILLTVVLTFTAAATAIAAVDADWRIHIRDAAVVAGKRVRLGEIADPVGTINQQNWNHFAAMELWSAPPRPGQPMTISKPKLRAELAKYLGEFADLAVYPPSIALQQGGAVVLQKELTELIVSSLTRYTAALEGEATLRDFQIPNFIFLSDRQNTLEMEPPSSLLPGQITLRFREVNPRGDLVKRVTGGAFLDQWKTVPCAAIPVNRHDSLEPQTVAYTKKNLAYLRGEVWNGKGGPWRVLRPIGTGSVIYQSDLELTPMMMKGNRVELLFLGKALRLSIPAEAMSDGKPGESIPVRNLQSKKQVYATVRDENTVVIQN